MRRILLPALFALVALPAISGFLPERSIPARRSMSWSSPLAAASFDGAQYTVLYTDLAELFVEKIDEDGNPAGSPYLLDINPVLSPRIVSIPGVSLALWSRRGKESRLAWIPADGSPTASFVVAGAFSIIAAGDHFLVGWSDAKGGYVSRLEPFANSVTSTSKVTDSPGAIRLAVAGSEVLAMWVVQDGMQPCFMEACPLLPVVRLLTSDGVPESKVMAWPQLSDAPMPSDANALFVGLDNASVIGRTGGALRRWVVRDADSLARASGRLYASTERRFCASDCTVLTDFGRVAADGHLANEYRFAGAIDDRYSMYPTLAAGTESLLIYYVNPMTEAIAYRIVDLTSPFPALPPPPSALTVSLSPSEPLATALLQWTPADSTGAQLVEADPLSDPMALHVLAPLPAGANSASFENLPADVTYAFRVFTSTAEGLSEPAESLQRTTPTPLPREATDFTCVVDSRVATFEWHDQSMNERGFRIRAIGDSCDQIVADVPANTTQATVPLLPGTNAYLLYAYNSLGSSPAFIYWQLFASVPRLRAVAH